MQQRIVGSKTGNTAQFDLVRELVDSTKPVDFDSVRNWHTSFFAISFSFPNCGWQLMITMPGFSQKSRMDWRQEMLQSRKRTLLRDCNAAVAISRNKG